VVNRLRVSRAFSNTVDAVCVALGEYPQRMTKKRKAQLPMLFKNYTFRNPKTAVSNQVDSMTCGAARERVFGTQAGLTT
jgi:hypothetical protein